MTKITHRTNLIIIVKKLIWTLVASIIVTIWLEWTKFLLLTSSWNQVMICKSFSIDFLKKIVGYETFT
jgi:hypothetical protein